MGTVLKTAAILMLILLGLCGCTFSGGLASPPLPPLPQGATGAAGWVRDGQGNPAPGAFVYAYRNDRGGFRGPADFGVRVEADGSYFLDLVEGRYFLVARLRKAGGGDAGPLRAGEAWSVFEGNPVEVERGQVAPVDFTLQGVTQPMLLKQGSLTAGDTGLSGRLVDESGKPVAGAFVLGYGNEDFRRVPDHTSLAVGPDGVFTLYLPEAGRVCLAARTRTRGQPVEGELYGVLGSGESGCRLVEKGRIEDVGDIVLRPFRR